MEGVGNVDGSGGGGRVTEATVPGAERTSKGFVDEAVSKEPPEGSVGIIREER